MHMQLSRNPVRWKMIQHFHQTFAVPFYCKQICKLSYRMLGAGDLALYGKGAKVNNMQISRIDFIMMVGCCHGVITE